MHQQSLRPQFSHLSRSPKRKPRRLRPRRRALRAFRPSAVLLALVLGTMPSTISSSFTLSASTYLCSGYAGCQAAGYSHAGYRQASSSMYWQMYAGHNCTNYVAYRMVQNGMPNTRPWQGSGNASNWGVEMASITDQTPRVGAVAWWKANVPPAGSSGHLAYVEKVISSTEILVSEDYWGGDFHWRRITKIGSGWPSGFIHFNDADLEARTPPTVTGTPAVGQPLQARPGTWAPRPTRFRYRWFADEVRIPGAASASYTPTPEVRGKTLTVKVTARRGGFAPGSATVSTDAVTSGRLAVLAPPVIEGTAEVDQQLTLRSPIWSSEPASSAVQWYADGLAVPGATGPTLMLGQEQIDKRITARVTATARGYKKAAATTSATAPVVAKAITMTTPSTVAGRPHYGSALVVRPGTTQPEDVRPSYTWMRDGSPVPGRTEPTYTLGEGDVGRRISVRADYGRPGYRSVTETVEVPGLVSAPATVRILATGKRGAAVIAIRVTAPGVHALSGDLTIRVGRHTVTAELEDGRSRLVVRDLRAGTKRVVVRYAGTPLVRSAVKRSTLTVLAGSP